MQTQQSLRRQNSLHEHSTQTISLHFLQRYSYTHRGKRGCLFSYVAVSLASGISWAERCWLCVLPFLVAAGDIHVRARWLFAYLVQHDRSLLLRHHGGEGNWL